MMAKYRPHGTDKPPAKPWKTRSWVNFPKLVVLALAGPIIAMVMAAMVLFMADESPIDNWPLAPTVYLAIITTLSNAMLRFAFSESSSLYWWSMLLSPSGVSLPELHTIWDISHSIFALAKFPTQQARQYLLRLTALLVILLAINGPFLQRAITVGFAHRVNVYEGANLPIRREPMWNLTTRHPGFVGHLWTSPPYQREVADLVSRLNRRDAIILPSPGCGLNATCTANVTVAGFTRTCNDWYRSLHGIESLGIARFIILPGFSVDECSSTGLSSRDSGPSEDRSGFCPWFETEFQLDVSMPGNTPEAPSEDDLPWKDKDLKPSMFSYTSFVRADKASPTLSIRQCNFSTSFINLPIRITNENIVDLIPTEDVALSSRRSQNGIESIPHPAGITGSRDFFIRGIYQIMADTYSGYMMFDTRENTYATLGLNTRQYINQSSISQRDPDESLIAPVGGFAFSFIDPFEDFVNTLNEVSLRYALAPIPQDRERQSELAKYFEYNHNDSRERIVPLMSTAFAETQDVNLEERIIIAVYKSYYVYTAVAVSITSLTSLLTLLLLRAVFSTHGRTFSMSPLEIAKAFSAPLLEPFGSNLTADDMSKASAAIRVRYGEARVNQQSQENSQHEPTWITSREESTTAEDVIMLVEPSEPMILRIDKLDLVGKPVLGRKYQ